jgi:hypothetical protein
LFSGKMCFPDFPVSTMDWSCWKQHREKEVGHFGTDRHLSTETLQIW